MVAAPAPVPIMKTGITMANPGAQRAYTLWYAAGNPGAATANAAGVNGAAVSGTVAGALSHTNPVSGNAYLSRLAMFASQGGSLVLIDRLWNNSGLSVTSTSAQAITPATLPARDATGTTNGVGVEFAVEWSATGGAGTPTVTLTYTDESGNAGSTGAFTAVTTPPVGTFEIFPLAAGDTGVRAPTSFIQSATRTSGTMHLVGFRRLAQVDIPVGGTCGAIDALTSSMPRVYDSSVLQLLWFPTATTATNLFGTYSEAQG
jgi:hypothetical protein